MGRPRPPPSALARGYTGGVSRVLHRHAPLPSGALVLASVMGGGRADEVPKGESPGGDTCAETGAADSGDTATEPDSSGTGDTLDTVDTGSAPLGWPEDAVAGDCGALIDPWSL